MASSVFSEKKEKKKIRAASLVPIPEKETGSISSIVIIGIIQSKEKYDKDGNQILEAYYVWDSELYGWVGYRKHEYSFDTDGKVIIDVKYNKYGQIKKSAPATIP